MTETSDGKEVIREVLVNISVVLLLAIIVGMLMYFRRLQVPGGLLSIVLGFYLARSSLAPAIGNTLSAMWSLFEGH